MKRILIVDDDPDVLENVAMILEDGYNVALARNGADALRRIESEHFDAILLDLGLPLKDGASVLREMRARKIDVPTIIVSASHDLPAKARALGAADYLTKPFTAARLEEKVAKLVGERASLLPVVSVASVTAIVSGAVGASAAAIVSGGSVAASGAASASGTGSASVPAGDAHAGESGRDPSPSHAMRTAPRALPSDVLDRARDLMEMRNSVLTELQHLPPDAFLLDCARRLGVLHGDEVAMGDLGDQLAFLDFCTYAFETRGRGAVDIYRAQRRSQPGSSEHIVLEAMTKARFSLFEVRRRLGSDGAILLDVLQRGRFTVVDDGVAQKPGTLIAGRIMPFEEFALLTAPCRVIPTDLGVTLRSDLSAMRPDALEQLCSGERKWQIELASWLLRASFAASHVGSPGTELEFAL